MGINLANSFGFDAKIGVFGIEPVPHQMRAQVVEMQDTSDFADRNQPPPREHCHRRGYGRLRPKIAKRHVFFIWSLTRQAMTYWHVPPWQVLALPQGAPSAVAWCQQPQ